MELDPIQARRDAEVVKYASWTGSTRQDTPKAEPDVLGEANKIVNDVRAGLRNGANKVVISSANKNAVEMAKGLLTADERAHVEFAELK